MALLPAGCYWIGDPCYVFPNQGPMKDKWNELLDSSCFLKNASSIPAEIDDGKIKVWCNYTAFGDGVYSSNVNFNFPVDAGILGIIPEETVIYLNTIDGVYVDSQVKRLGLFIIFEEDFTIEMSNGWFRFGHVIINTDEVNF